MFVSLLALALAVLALCSLLPLHTRLLMSDFRSGDMLTALPIRKGERFKISYTHSANLSPVADTIEWTGETLMVRESEFKTFGAGIPVPADGIGKELVKTDEGFRLIGIDEPRESILLMTSEIPDHHLLYRDTKISLLKRYGAGRAVKLEVKRTCALYCFIYGTLWIKEGM